MLWFVYNALFAVGFLLMMPRFLFRMWRRGGYLRLFRQRFAMLSRDELDRIRSKPRIWVHAVSVGEVFVALRFMDELRATRPDAFFVLTTTTSTGHAVATRRLCPEDVLLYFPADFPVIVRRALAAIRPRALILVEGELWPNLIRLTREAGSPVVLINGRMSQNSLKGYGMLKPFFKRGMDCFACLCVQSSADAARFVSLGADPGRVRVTGSAKYDVAQADHTAAAAAAAVLAAAGVVEGDLLIVGGSTWPGEESALLRILPRIRQTVPRVRLVLVPRHAERAATVSEEIRRSGLRYVRRSALREGTANLTGACDVVLVDTTGELQGFYSHADVIFVGKSLTQHGGQNVIEPALLGKAVVVGPHMENFAGVMEDFVAANAIVRVENEAALEKALFGLLTDAPGRASLGRRAAELVSRKRGSLASTVEIIGRLLSPS